MPTPLSGLSSSAPPSHLQEQLDASSILRHSLSLPRQRPDVADWVFDERGHSFHASSGLLPPSAFHLSAALFSSVEDRLSTQPEPALTCLAYTLFIPARFEHNVLFGYTIFAGSPFHAELFPLSEALRSNTCLVGRFAFYARSYQIVCYMSNVVNQHSVVLTGDRLGKRRRQRCYFSVPNEHYGRHNLPSTVLGMTIRDENLLCTQATMRASRGGVEALVPAFAKLQAQRQRSSHIFWAGQAGPVSPAQDSPIPESACSSTELAVDLPWEGDVTALHPHLLDAFEAKPGQEKRPAKVSHPSHTALAMRKCGHFFKGIFAADGVTYARGKASSDTALQVIKRQEHAIIVGASEDDCMRFSKFAAHSYYSAEISVTYDEHYLNDSSRDENTRSSG